MNTQAKIIRLEAGQALALPRRGKAVLTEGELRMQEPARWLAGMVVLPAPVRLGAPASLPASSSCSFVAVHACNVVVHQSDSVFAPLRTAASWLRGLRVRGHGTPRPLAG